jgi:hypothetical protein
MRHTRSVKLAGLAVLFAAGALLAGTAFADTTTTVETTTEATTITEPVETVTTVSTETVQVTTTHRIPVPTSPSTTTSSESSSSSTPTWVWILLAALGLALVAAVAMLLTRKGGSSGETVAPQERRRRLDVAIGSWAGQGWALEHQTGDSAVLRRGAEQMMVSVDEAGQISTRPLSSRDE